MKNACFLDANILIYAAMGKQSDPLKYRIAYDLVLHEEFCISGQILAEFYSSITKKKSLWLPLPEIEQWFELLSNYPTAPVDSALVQAGVYLSQKYKIDYYDAAIIAAAERQGAPILYTEDLNHEQSYGSVRVVNPFRIH